MTSSPQSRSYKNLMRATSGTGNTIPSLKRTGTQSSNGSTKPLSLQQPKSSNFEFSEDIDCRDWLGEIGLEHYAHTFLTNLSSDGYIILRRRLSNIRLQDLSQMNITDFDDQKAIMAHIKLVLKHPFNSAVRKREVAISEPVVMLKNRQASMAQSKSPLRTSNVAIVYADGKDHDHKDHHAYRKQSKDHLRVPSIDFSSADDNKADEKGVANNNAAPNSSSAPNTKDLIAGSKRDASTKDKQLQRKQNARRRRSFDSQIWDSITSMRTKQAVNANAASNLREGILPTPKTKDEDTNNSSLNNNSNNNSNNASKNNRRRRHSFDPDGAKNGAFDAARDKATAYGNMALEYDMMLSGLKTLQSEYLNKFKSMIGCEKASIFFVNDLTRELVLFTDTGEHFRIPPGSGIAGVCAETGVGMNIPDAYADERFNRNLDIRTGFRTRNILCQPVRRSRGGGHIVAVVQMINKDANQDFGADDEDVLAACAEKVGDMLSDQFMALQSCAERFLATATFVAGKSNVYHSPSAKQHAPTSRSVQFESIVTEIDA